MKINESDILIIFDVDGNIWFKYRDVLKALEYNNIDNAINTINVNDLFKQKYKNIRVSIGLETLKNMQPEQMFINESGLYEVFSNSTKILAKQFMHKYFTDIMPKIRQTGQYILNDTDKKKLDEMNNELNNYKQELTYYYDKYDFVPSKIGYLYINQNNSIKDSKTIICYKIGYASDMKERLRNYKVGNFNHKILCYIPLDINRKEIEKCVKNRNKSHLIKLVTDSICYLTLEELKKEIIDCINFMKSHICHCLHCQEKYEFENLETHKCTEIKEFIDVNIESEMKNKTTTKSSEESKKTKPSEESKKSKSSKGSKKSKPSKGSKKSKSSKGSKINKLSKGSKINKSIKGSKINKSIKSSKKSK